MFIRMETNNKAEAIKAGWPIIKSWKPKELLLIISINQSLL
nr:hypothetical protein [Lactiplantibacillus plantarum]